jgi:phosphatidylglycerophosphate synthase
MTRKLTCANLLTFFRLFSAPLLIGFAVMKMSGLFVAFFAAALVSDALDGYIARRLDQCSIFGTKLDSAADVALWSAAFVSLFILWPEIAWHEAYYAITMFVAFILPPLVGFLKYGSAPSYHSYLAKFQAVFVSVAIFLLLFFRINWPFRLAVIIQVLVAIEDIAITAVLPDCRHNVKSFWHLKGFRPFKLPDNLS